MGHELEAVGAMLEAEGRVLKDLADEGKHLTDPVDIERNRAARDAQVKLFHRVNEALAKHLG